MILRSTLVKWFVSVVLRIGQKTRTVCESGGVGIISLQPAYSNIFMYLSSLKQASICVANWSNS